MANERGGVRYIRGDFNLVLFLAESLFGDGGDSSDKRLNQINRYIYTICDFYDRHSVPLVVLSRHCKCEWICRVNENKSAKASGG